MMKLVGVALIVLGIVALVYQGITYTTSEKVIDLGPLKAEVERKKTIPLSPLVLVFLGLYFGLRGSGRYGIDAFLKGRRGRR